MTPGWLEPIEHLATILVPFATFVLGKATKGGANQTKLDNVCFDMADIKKQMSQHAATLASHTTLHEGYVRSFQSMDRTLMDTSTKLSKICGKLGVE